MNLNVAAPRHNQFKAATAAQGKNMTDVLLKFIRTYVTQHLPVARRQGRP